MRPSSRPIEEEALRTRHNLIANAENIVSLASQVYEALYEGEDASAANSLNTSLKALESLAEIDDRFRSHAAEIENALSTVDDVAAEVRRFKDEVEYSPDELEKLNQRLAQISDLKRKFGESVEAILAYRARAAEEIDQYDQRDQRLGEIRAKHLELTDIAQKAAQELSQKRREAARALDKRVTGNLTELGMENGRFETQFEPADLGPSGVDRIEFLLTANVGEKPKPLKQVASGGEISRVMLALKTTFAQADQIPTLIFDEIDAGIGGAVAAKVADKLSELAKLHQTICVTHLPQIAAAAALHYHVEKREEGGRTLTSLRRVEGQERVEEVARLLDGSVTEVSQEHARALLRKEADKRAAP